MFPTAEIRLRNEGTIRINAPRGAVLVEIAAACDRLDDCSRRIRRDRSRNTAVRATDRLVSGRQTGPYSGIRNGVVTPPMGGSCSGSADRISARFPLCAAP